jgi:hypothetical protein
LAVNQEFVRGSAALRVAAAASKTISVVRKFDFMAPTYAKKP